MSNTTYMNLFPARPRLRPSDVARLAEASAADTGSAAEQATSPFSGKRVERAFDLMGRWNSRSSADHSVAIPSLAH